MTTASLKAYHHLITRILGQIAEEEGEKILTASEWVRDAVLRGGVLHLFGSGHSELIAREAKGRAGGLAPVNVIIDKTQGIIEHLEGYASSLLEAYRVEKKDAFIVISTSGRNPLPIEMAMEAKKKGLKVVAITSLRFADSVSSRHSSGKKLHQIADLVIDNHGEVGDASIRIEGVETPLAPTSTVAGTYIVNLIVLGALEMLKEKGMEPPVFKSANLDGSKEHNKRLKALYPSRLLQ